MWPLSLFCLAALLQLGWDVQCCAHVVGDSSVHVRQEYTSGMLSDSTEMKAEAAYGALSYAGRKLKQSHHPPLASSTSIIKALAQVCPNVDTASAVFICQAAQTTLSSGQSLEVSLQMPADTATLHALEVTVQPTEGDADVIVYIPGQQDEGPLRLDLSQQVGTGLDQVYVESAKAPPGSNITVQVFPAGESATFTITIEVLEEGNRKISDRDAQVLTDLSTACCAHGGCHASLQSFAQQNQTFDVCHDSLLGWHCNADGHLTHILLTNLGMQCSLDSFQNLTQLSNLHRFELDNAMEVEGDINTLISAFAQDHQLKVMIIRDTSISGSLAANCPTDSVLGNLLQLHIETSPVTGLVPDCVMSLSSLSLIHTDIGGALPAIPTSSPLKVLELVQKNDDGERITGDAAAFANLSELTSLRLEYTAVTGVLKTGTRVTDVYTIGSQHDSFKAGNPLVLKKLQLDQGRQTGPVPKELLNSPALTHLSLKGNEFSSMPQEWEATALIFLDLSDNAIEGPVPPSLGSQLALEVADLSNNLLEGPLNALTSEIIDNSRLYRLNLANNRLSGPVSGMQNLGVFREVVGIHRHTSTHVLNISANNFEGDLPFLYYAATSVGGASQLPRLDIDMKGNPLMICPDPSTVSNQVGVFCDSEETADADASSKVPTQDRSPPSKEKLSAGSIAAVCISLLVVFALLAASMYYYRRRRGKNDGEYMAYEDTSASVPQAQGDEPQQASLNIEL